VFQKELTQRTGLLKMQVKEAVTLIKTNEINTTEKSVWADLGCGTGIFTYALGSLLYPGSTLFAIDKKPGVKHSVLANSVLISPIEADFEKYNFQFGKCDGMLMTNSLHYVSDKINFINRLKKHMNENALFLIIEYDTDEPVPKWVPFPISFHSLTAMFEKCGYQKVIKLNERKSIYGDANIYSALIRK